MEHFQSYSPRKVLQLPNAELGGWQLKRYAVLAHDRVFDSAIASSALESAVKRLPRAGKLANSDGNHGVGFQIIHFAEIAVVSPVFYWIWGTVLANTHQMRAQWEEPTTFETGVKEVVGCVWEMEIVCFETQAWQSIMLESNGDPRENLGSYMQRSLPVAESIS